MTRADGTRATEGRPLKFKSLEDLQTQIDQYFTDAKEQDLPYTVTGLALALDTTRETLIDYQDKSEYSDAIKKAKLKCQNYTENFLYSGKNATGAIFSLKNNYSWRDKSEIEARVETVTPILGGKTNVPVDNSND